MPKNKGRRGEANGYWEAGETEESYVNGSDGNGSSNRTPAGGGGENGHDMDNDNINNNPGGGRRRRTRRSSSVQHRPKYSLGPWTESVSETVRCMGATHQAFKDLQGRFESHLDDLRAMEETKEALRRLKEECREKSEELQRHATTIDTLSSMNRNTREMIEQQKETIEQERRDLEQEKAKLDKRVTTAMAEERLKLKIELDKLVKEHGQSYDERKKELEDEYAVKMEKNNSRVAALEAENGQLSTIVEKQKAIIEDQAKKLEKSIEQYDILERAKDSIKTELRDRERELKMLEREFALNPKSKEYFKQSFTEIYRIIENISLNYFNEIDGKDLEEVHEELVAADPCFKSVPIDDSDDSRNLRIAHAQRIISDVICKYIWKPFRSEFTLSHPDFEGLLAKISDQLEKSSHGGRTANFWTAFTIRGLESLPADPALARPPDIKEPQPLRPTISSRAEEVVSEVLSVLSPLISPSRDKALRSDLLSLTNLAIGTWNDAQTGELKVTISTSLKPAHREEWRSQKLDPASPPGSYAEIGSDITSQTHPRIYTLFPRVVAWEVVGPIKPDAGPPGSWPSESDQGPRRIETCIHPGVGLPECSPLVVRGKEEQEEKSEYLSKVLEMAKKELHSNKRLTAHGRRQSTTSLASPPSSPS